VGHSKAVLAIDFWDESSCVSGGLDQSLRWWNVADAAVKRSLTNHVGPVVGLLPDSSLSALGVPADTVPERREERGRLRRLWSVGADRTVRLWQPEVGRMVRFVRLPETPTVACWDAANGGICVGGRDGRVWRVAADSLEVTEVGQWGQEQGVAALAVHPGDGTLVVSGAFGLQVVD
jgi:WD40 repeat protein